MDIQKLVNEAVLADTVNSTKQELESIKESIIHQMIIEGVDDPGILKCVFMAGGPGAGKGFVSQETFGIDDSLKSSFSATGLKVVGSDVAFEAAMKKHGINSKELSSIEKENPELWDFINGDGNANSLRSKAKVLTAKQKAFFEEGRLGMIIDGTGHNFNKIKGQKKKAESLGYDTMMVFVDTSLEVAQQRNLDRPRVLSSDVVASLWKETQGHISKYKSLFGGSFEIVNNTSYEGHDYAYKNPNTKKITTVKRPLTPQIRKATQKFMMKPLQNKVGKAWIKAARLLDKNRFIK